MFLEKSEDSISGYTICELVQIVELEDFQTLFTSEEHFSISGLNEIVFASRIGGESNITH